MHLDTFLYWKCSLYSRRPSPCLHHLRAKEGAACGAVEEAGTEGLWHQRRDLCEHAGRPERTAPHTNRAAMKYSSPEPVNTDQVTAGGSFLHNTALK